MQNEIAAYYQEYKLVGTWEQICLREQRTKKEKHERNFFKKEKPFVGKLFF